MARSARSRPGRTLLVLVGLIAVLYGVIAAGVHWDKAQWTPKLALDLAGGTQIILSPQPVNGQTSVNSTAVDESVNIIRQRVNGSGISEAEVTRQGEGADTKIIVSLPGKPDPETISLVERAAQLQFRPVIQAAVTQAPAPAATGTPTPAPTGSPTEPGSGSSKTTPAPSRTGATLKPSPKSSTSGMNVPSALRQPTAVTPTPTASGGSRAVTTATTAAAASTPTPTGSAKTATPTPSAKPTDASDPNWVTPAVQAQFDQLDCADPKAVQALRSQTPDPNKPFITCADDGAEKYLLGPAELVGTDVTGATAGLETNSQGFTGTAWEVDLTFSPAGAEKFGKVTTRLYGLTGDRNRFAIVLDNLVISAPTTQAAITTGSARITGNFTQDTATTLANQLKYGALPVSFRVDAANQISATLGADYLRRGLLAGVIGLVLVVLYSLLQYRALGFVTVASLAVAGTITYGLVVLLGWRQGFRLSLAGVAGLIVSIGITADSFIVFFERIRDEVRDGRALLAAVETGWARARRTILASDTVSFLAAIVLYLLAIGNVRGFAFTLGLTTLVDIAVVFMFTKPTVTLLARTTFFGGGHRLSGFDAEHLGRSVAYAGRGRVRTPAPATAGGSAGPGEPGEAVAAATTEGGGRRPTLAERRAERERAAAAAAGEGSPGGQPGDRVQQTTTTSGRES
ncbi:MAG TPA: protein translocase subunit SecD [Kineosporiaceae bacterium]|nr:protein translocase subunit SecD [Kineosporiaceae bacterium]